MSAALLADLIEYSRDGEWGGAESGDGLTEMRIVRGTDFDSFREGHLSSLPVRFIASRKARDKRLLPGDILIETAGGTATRPTGRTVLVRDEHLENSDLPLTCASFARFIRIDPAKAEPAFVQLWLDNAWRTRDLLGFNVQHTGVARFQWTKCSESLKIPLPDRATQKRVAATFLTIDHLIVNNRRRIELLEEMARVIYREWFVDFRFPGHETATFVESVVGPVPEGWEVRRLDEVAEVNRASARPKPGEVVKYLDISALGERTIGRLVSFDGADAPGRARRLVSAGDVVWSMVRPNRRAHGLLINPAKDWIVSTGIAVLTPTSVSSALLFETVSTREFSDYLVSKESGAAYPAVKPGDFATAPFLVPPEELDREFAAAVGPNHKLVWTLAQASERLRELRDLLLPWLVTGQIDVSSLDLDAVVEPSVA
jgi:type I restriction enzyme S subunit